MKHYVVTDSPLQLAAGSIVELTVDQYRRRKHAVEPVDKLPEKWESAVFRAKQPIQFKSGEKIGTTADIPKVSRTNVIPVTVGEVLTDDGKDKAAKIGKDKAAK